MINQAVRRTACAVTMVGAFGLAFASPVHAQAAGSAADARCLVAMSLMLDKASRADKSGFESGTMYFLGKLVARGGMKSVNPAIEAAAGSVTEARAASVASTCADEISRAGDAM